VKRYPIVHIQSLDHCTSSMNNSEPMPIDIVGILYKETSTHYQLRHWIFSDDMDDEDNVTSAIVKTRLTTKKIIGYWAVKEAK
jgi:hypothetical protein